MKIKHTFTLSPLLLAMGLQTAFAQDAEQVANVENNEEQTETIQIVGVRQTRASKGATGLTMELSETPQSISIVTSELIKNFAANNINDALKLATGVTVEEYETT
ncbi:MAG: TonB-dependent receptor plug domain-containing protein, partial [Paraglaciecola sp.]